MQLNFEKINEELKKYPEDFFYDYDEGKKIHTWRSLKPIKFMNDIYVSPALSENLQFIFDSNTLIVREIIDGIVLDTIYKKENFIGFIIGYADEINAYVLRIKGKFETKKY